MTLDEAKNALAHAENLAQAQGDIVFWLRADPRQRRQPDFAGLDRYIEIVNTIIAEHGADFCFGPSHSPTSAAAVRELLDDAVAQVAEFRPKTRRAAP